MNADNKKFKVIRKIKLCNYLINKGFNFIETRVDYKYTSRYVWIFPYNDKLEKAISDYYSKIK